MMVKKGEILYLLMLLLFGASSCNDSFMERYPTSELSPETYFTNENELRSYTNGFYNALPDANAVFYNVPNQGDDEARSSVSDELRGVRVIPTTGGKWSWSELRRINFFLKYSHQTKDDVIRNKYDALARFFRAYFYFEKIVDLGNVPWYDDVLATDDEGLTKARDPRNFVFSKILEDIDFAIANLEKSKKAYEITKWTALALKSRICLFEGTFRKYHNLGDYEEILDECISASEALIDSKEYSIYMSNPLTAYHELFVAEDAIVKEVILARQYDEVASVKHQANYYLLTTAFGSPGVQKSLIDSYLMNDGKRFTDMPNYKTMQFYEETQNRDPRMSQTIRTPGYKRMDETSTSVPQLEYSVTGYQFSKYVWGPKYDVGNQTNDIPIFRYAEVLLNFAEAKAERGTLTQTDINKSIKLLRDRVGMPNMDLNFSNTYPDPYMESEYMNVDKGANKGVILEIRRERRIELIKEGFRYNDILRWKEGKRFERTFYGMYFPGPGDYDLDRDGKIDLTIYDGEKPSSVSGRQYQKLSDLNLENDINGGRIRVNTTISRYWDENKDYFYPIPTQERILNPNLTQNPGWDDGL